MAKRKPGRPRFIEFEAKIGFDAVLGAVLAYKAKSEGLPVSIFLRREFAKLAARQNWFQEYHGYLAANGVGNVPKE